MKKKLSYLNPKKFSMFSQLILVIILFLIIFGSIEAFVLGKVSKKATLSDYSQKEIKTFLNTSFDSDDINDFKNTHSYIVLTIDNGIIQKGEYQNNVLVNDVLESLPSWHNKGNYETSKIKYNDNAIYLFKTSTVLIIVPTELSTSYLDSIALYQTVVVFLILAFGVGFAFIFRTLYIDPIDDMTLITAKIKEQKFSYRNLVYNNKNYQKLGNQINELSDSLKNVIDSLNYKNEEITRYANAETRDHEFQKQLVATISHEIKTPLAVMQATISGIIDGIFTPEETEGELQNVLKEIESTNKMLQEIVDLYKMETTKFQLTKSDFNLNDLLFSTIHNLRKIADKYEQTISFDPKQEVLINADIEQIARVLNNVILNGITYSPKGNTITIELLDKTNYFALEIINYGITINNLDLDKVFEPFYRADKSRQKKEDHGNGLGLYLVREILRKHDFEFGIENVINGVKFYVLFPRLKNKA